MTNFTSMMNDSGRRIMYDPLFLRHLYSYFPNFRKDGVGFDTLTVSETEALRYKGDLRGLFLHKGVPAEFVYPSMIFNHIENGYEFDGLQTEFNVLNNTEVDKVIKSYNVSQKITL